MNAPPCAWRLVLSAPVAASALLAGFHGLPVLLPVFDLRPVLCIWLAVALLLAWLLAPWGGRATLAELLTPDAARSARAGLLVVVLGAALAGAVALLVFGFGEALDLDEAPWQRASVRDLAGGFALALGLAAFHGLYILGWALGQQLRLRRLTRGCFVAGGLSVAYPTLSFAAAGLPEFGLGTGFLFFAPISLLMMVPVLLGGRVWTVILGAAAVAMLPLIVLGLPGGAAP